MNLNVAIYNGIAKVLLDHPPLNILSEKVKEEITEIFQTLAQDRTVRVVLFHTNGEHFCCGADLKEFPGRIQSKTARHVWMRGHAMLASIIHIPQPTVAYITGNALGGGAELASAFDIRIFASNARIGYPEVLRGVFPGNGGLERLISLVGEGHAMRLVLTGKSITAEEAFKIGLASEVIPDAEGKNYTEEIARYLASLPGTALKTIKQAIRMYSDNPAAFDAKGKELFYMVHETHDVREAVQAFIEKRKPSFIHQ